MMRFMQDFDKLERVRNMETIVTFFGYYTTDDVTPESVPLIQRFYLIWILNLIIASVHYNVSNPIAFATYRVGFRVVKGEFGYLANGVSGEKITYPGKWITVNTDRQHVDVVAPPIETMIEENSNYRAFDDEKILDDFEESEDVILKPLSSDVDYDKLERVRNMEFTLLASLTIENIVTFFGYYTTDDATPESVPLIQTFYLIRILNLVIASVLYNVSNSIAFASYRVGFRIMHMAALAYIFYTYGQMIASKFIVRCCLLEFGYLANIFQ